jgi:hypothetical protein
MCVGSLSLPMGLIWKLVCGLSFRVRWSSICWTVCLCLNGSESASSDTKDSILGLPHLGTRGSRCFCVAVVLHFVALGCYILGFYCFEQISSVNKTS